jgi:hypothetical protein
VAVAVPGSPERPHFAGRAYVREGTQTKDASARQFEELIASRSGKARAIQEWIGKEISILQKSPHPHRAGLLEEHSFGNTGPIVARSCNAHFLTFEIMAGTGQGTFMSLPLGNIELSFDHQKKCLIVFYYKHR